MDYTRLVLKNPTTKKIKKIFVSWWKMTNTGIFAKDNKGFDRFFSFDDYYLLYVIERK